MTILAKAGALPYRRLDSGAIELLSIAPHEREHWIFPMGHVDTGDTPEQAAQREAAEEAGVATEIGPQLGELRWVDAADRHHVVQFFLARYIGDTEWPERHKRRRKWIPLAVAQNEVAPDFRHLVAAAVAALQEGNRASQTDG